MLLCPAGCGLSFGRKSSSSNRSRRRVQTVVQKLVENYCFSTVLDDTLGTFWARFWPRSVLRGHCVSLSGRVRFQPRFWHRREEEQQQQQQEQQEGSMSHCTNNRVQKPVENYCFSTVLDDTLGTFWARFWRRSVLQGHCVSLSGRVRFQPRAEEQQQQQQQEQQESSMSHCTNSGIKTDRKLLFFYDFRRHVSHFLGSILAPFGPSGPLYWQMRFQPRRCLTQFFYGFRRHIRHFSGSILALFRPSGPPCFTASTK